MTDVMRWHKCDECDGDGRVQEDPDDGGSVHTCMLCHGVGKVLRGQTWEERE